MARYRIIAFTDGTFAVQRQQGFWWRCLRHGEYWSGRGKQLVSYYLTRAAAEERLWEEERPERRARRWRENAEAKALMGSIGRAY